MNKIRTMLLAAAAILLPTIASAQAGTYYLDSRNPDNGMDVALLSGAWTIGVSYGGWSPWNYVSGCDGAGNNCQTGFHTVFYYTVNGGPITKYGWDGSERTQFTPDRVNDFYSTPALALTHAFAPFELDLAAPATLHLFIPDCCYYDNTGGLGITVASVERVNTTVPEPSALALSGIGLSLLALAAARKRRVTPRVTRA